MAEIYIGLGSNLGNRKQNIEKAIYFLKKRCKILKVSSLYNTEPVGYKKQKWFLNCVAKAKTKLQPEELLLFTNSIEKKLKKNKNPQKSTIFGNQKIQRNASELVANSLTTHRIFSGIKNGPRTIDIDILFYGNKIIKIRNLSIPHPRLHKRAFVLKPFSDINPDFVHPSLKKSIKKLLAELHSRKKVEIYRKTIKKF